MSNALCQIPFEVPEDVKVSSALFDCGQSETLLWHLTKGTFSHVPPQQTFAIDALSIRGYNGKRRVILGGFDVTAQEFCYWLQGYYELSGSELLTKKQAVIIKAHLDMVALHEKGDGRSVQFCQELLSLFTPKFGVMVPVPETICGAIRQRLSEVFLHEIDPSYPVEEQEALTDLHEAQGPWNYPPRVKC
jgi:hypothetical protein